MAWFDAPQLLSPNYPEVKPQPTIGDRIALVRQQQQQAEANQIAQQLARMKLAAAQQQQASRQRLTELYRTRPPQNLAEAARAAAEAGDYDMTQDLYSKLRDLRAQPNPLTVPGTPAAIEQLMMLTQRIASGQATPEEIAATPAHLRTPQAAQMLHDNLARTQLLTRVLGGGNLPMATVRALTVGADLTAGPSVAGGAMTGGLAGTTMLDTLEKNKAERALLVGEQRASQFGPTQRYQLPDGSWVDVRDTPGGNRTITPAPGVPESVATKQMGWDARAALDKVKTEAAQAKAQSEQAIKDARSGQEAVDKAAQFALEKDPVIKGFSSTAPAFTAAVAAMQESLRALKAGERLTAAQVATIYNTIKVFDNNAVREGEIALFQSSQSLWDKFTGIMQRLNDGGTGATQAEIQDQLRQLSNIRAKMEIPYQAAVQAHRERLKTSVWKVPEEVLASQFDSYFKHFSVAPAAAPTPAPASGTTTMNAPASGTPTMSDEDFFKTLEGWKNGR